MSAEKTIRRPFRLGFAVAAIAIGCALGIACMEGAARLIAPHWREYASNRFMNQGTGPEGRPVVVGRPGFDGYFAQNDGDFRIRIRLNDAGLRNDEPAAAANGRIWAVGDSFTFGWGVAPSETYSAVLGRVSGQPVFNVAAPGGDVTNYRWLVARMPKTAKPRLVVVGLTIENDLSDYRSKPRAAVVPPADGRPGGGSFKEWGIENSALYNLLAVAVKKSEGFRNIFVELGLVAAAHDLRTAPDREAVRVLAESTAAEIDRLRDALPPSTPLAVLIIPSRFEILNGDPGWSDVRALVAAALTARNIPMVDPTAELKAAGFRATHFAHDGHWSARGHEIAGRALAAWIAAHAPLAPFKTR